VVLVEQMRAPALDDPAGPWLVEVVAGIIEPGETAAEVVRREANEEAGLEVGELVALFDTLLSPGGSTERISLFVGRVDSARAGGVHGNADEEEDIRVVVWPLDEACAMIGTSIVTAPAIVCLQWLALNREQVRRKWGASEVAVP
jgi:ADP-ribose pyrophosphatase